MSNFLFKLQNISLRHWQHRGSSFLLQPHQITKNRTVLKNVNWTFKKNQNWIIVAKNGEGKTLLTKSLNGGCQILNGHVVWASDIINSPKNVRFISLEQQENLMSICKIILERGSYNRFTAEDLSVQNFLHFETQNYGFRANDSSDLISEEENRFLHEIVQELNIKPLLPSKLHELSTGEFRKILIVKSLISQPKVIVCDEIFDGLDIKSKENLFSFLNSDFFSAKGSYPRFIFISHRADEIQNLLNITNVLEINQGKVHEFTRDEFEPRLAGMDHSAGQSTNDETDLRTLASSLINKNLLPLSQTLLEVRNLTLLHPRTKTEIDIDHWRIRNGEFHILQGSNGSAKSFLIDYLTGEVDHAFSTDSVHLVGLSPAKVRFKGLDRLPVFISSQKRQISFFQEFMRYKQSWTVDRLLKEELDESTSKADQLFGMKKLRFTPVVKLSQGQQRRLFLTILFGYLFQSQYKEKLLILDEPFHGLDVDSRKRLIALINFLVKENQCGLLLVTHNADEITNLTPTTILKLDHQL
eukprot:maker-scaffold_16-snap-gene-1.19-mRNA-1 protein AED:0.00 eAED:0.00 QI:35/1/1/1/1/1/3/179/526